MIQRASRRYLLQHPWLTGLSILGIALGVAVVVSIDLANASAERAFDLSAARVTGRATHHVIGADGLSGDVYRRLRVEHGIRPSAPIVEGYVSYGGEPYQLLGIDPFADRPFRPYAAELSSFDLDTFLGRGSSVIVSPLLGTEPGDSLHLSVGGRTRVVTVGGILEPEDALSSEATARLIVTDVGTAQHLLQIGGRLTRIDLIRGDVQALEAVLPEGVRVVRSEARTEAVEQMTDAFALNLRALSLLALVVAMFLIYNTMTFSVVQRRALIGRLRAVGVTRREIFRTILLEASVLGALGAVVGLLLGLVMAQGLVRMVTQTINDLYYVLEVRTASIDLFVLAKGALLGIIATAASAVPAGIEAASSPVGIVLQRSREEEKLLRRVPTLAVAGLAVAAISALVLVFSGRNLALSYVGLVMLLAAFALLTPGAARFLASGARKVLGAPFGLIGRMAAQSVIHNLSRTSVAIAALSIAVAAAVGVGVMVGSFRDTVSNWLDYRLQADLYVQAPGSGVRLREGSLDEQLVERLRRVAGVEAVSSVRRMDLLLPSGIATLTAVDPAPRPDRSVQFREGDGDEIWKTFSRGDGVAISEPFAFRHGVSRGDTLVLPTDRGNVPFPVAGVFYDYGSDQGVVTMSRDVFLRHFDAEGLSGISIYGEHGTNLAELERRARAVVGDDQHVVIRSNRALREASLEVFDRTFAITTVLRMLALLVAFAGVVSALMALQVERAGEFAILRAEGMTPGQVSRFLTLQSTVMGVIAGLLALPLGIALAYILVFVINKRSFGWTLQFSVPYGVLLEALLVAVLAAVIAGIYPSWKLARARTADALRTASEKL